MAKTYLMRKSNLLLAVLILFSLAGRAQTPKIGQKAPSIQFEKILSKGVPDDFYKGKFLVLEFWATWCLPCIAHFPYLDSVAKAIKSNRLAFAIISCEEAGKVSRFFETRTQFKIDYVSLIDKNDPHQNAGRLSGATFSHFNIRYIPQTFIIDPDGILKWSGYPSELTTELIKNIIDGRAALSPTVAQDEMNPALQSDSAVIDGYDIKGKVLTKTNGVIGTEYDKDVDLYVGGMKLNELIATLFQYKNAQVLLRTQAGTGMPIVQLTVHRDRGAAPDSVALTVLKQLGKFYHFSFHLAAKNFPAYDIILEDPERLLDNKNTIPFDTTADVGSYQDNKRAIAINSRLDWIISFLSNRYPDLIVQLSRKNLDKISGRKFDFDIPPGDLAQTLEFLHRQYGLILKKKMVRLPIVVGEPGI